MLSASSSSVAAAAAAITNVVAAMDDELRYSAVTCVVATAYCLLPLLWLMLLRPTSWLLAPGSDVAPAQSRFYWN